jgi:hypothetical protein
VEGFKHKETNAITTANENFNAKFKVLKRGSFKKH